MSAQSLDDTDCGQGKEEGCPRDQQGITQENAGAAERGQRHPGAPGRAVAFFPHGFSGDRKHVERQERQHPRDDQQQMERREPTDDGADDDGNQSHCPRAVLVGNPPLSDQASHSGFLLFRTRRPLSARRIGARAAVVVFGRGGGGSLARGGVRGGVVRG